jgi:hypothetical protein
MVAPEEDEFGNYVFTDTDKCFKHYDYKTSIRCPVCSRRGGCYAATLMRVKAEREKEPVPNSKKCCHDDGDDEFPPYYSLGGEGR